MDWYGRKRKIVRMEHGLNAVRLLQSSPLHFESV